MARRHQNIEFKDLNLEKELSNLKKLIGGWALRALLKGKPLTQWRRTTPHNWFIKGHPRYEYTYLWHVDEFNWHIPNLKLFEKKCDAKVRICNHWLAGRDAGVSESSEYVLRKPVVNAAKKLGYI
jgi:hypothetical protein